MRKANININGHRIEHEAKEQFYNELKIKGQLRKLP